MQFWPRIAMFMLFCATLLAACGPAVTQSEPVATMTPIGGMAFAENTRVAGIDIGGMKPAAAATYLQNELATLTQPLIVRAGDASVTIQPEDIALQVPLEEVLASVQAGSAGDNAAIIPFRVMFDQAALRKHVTALAEQARVLPIEEIQVLTSTEVMSRSFGYYPGRSVDIEAGLKQIETRLNSRRGTRLVRLPLQMEPSELRADFAQIQAQVDAMADEWEWVAGVYMYDLASGTAVTYNADTVFSGASVLKVAIMLYAYTHLSEFNAEENDAMRRAIVESDNLAANDILAAAAGGTGTEDALVGTQEMNAMLVDLGLAHTYQNMPYEAGDFLIGVMGLSIPRGPAQEGSPPYTEADPTIRTTPAEIGRLFVLIDECSRGEGELLERYADTLSADQCQEMLDLLALNSDTMRIPSGLPAGTRVEHKSGWVEDMQADVGIVRSPGGDFVLAVYLYQERPKSWLKDEIANPIIGNFARLVYTAYNPVPLQ